METKQVSMSAEELAQFEAFKKQQEKEAAAKRRKENREAYAQLVDEEIDAALPELKDLSQQIAAVKSTVYGNFAEVLKMKAEVMGLTQDGQKSHTFTNSKGDKRITLGVNTVDGYRDTVEDGITMVQQYIQSLAIDENSRALVKTVLRLLSRDQQGNIKASRVLQLRRMAEETGNDQFIEGVRIIEESYQPTTTKQYIRAEYKDEKGIWRNVPLSVTDVG
jgi:hypothetical protein